MKRKVLLMGKSGAGKTSMRSIIFANYMARDTRRLGPTWGFENTDIKFLGNLVLNLWDCGGQETFMENYFDSQREQIFKNVQVLIYVFDISSKEKDRDMQYFHRCIKAIEENSKDASVFCLLHKMDNIPESQREATFVERAQELTNTDTFVPILCFGTSIWDETLYRAWSAIVYSLVPNADRLNSQLCKLRELCGANEVVLFERETFLVISSAEDETLKDTQRYEKISNIMKQFKLSCARTHSTFESVEVRNGSFTAYIDGFTSNTYLMIIVTDPRVGIAATTLGLKAARPYFEKHISMTQ